MEVQERIDDYKVKVQMDKQRLREKKADTKVMIEGDIARDKQKRYDQSVESKAMDHLVNTKEIMLMGDMEKLRVTELRTKKLLDDKLNRKKEVENRQFRDSNRMGN